MKHRSISGFYRYESILKAKIIEEDYVSLRNYAITHGISLSEFRDYTGNIQEIMDIIDKINIVAKDFPKIVDARKHVVLGLKYEVSEDFAGTEANKIILNGIFYNDTEILAAEYDDKMKQGFFVRGTTWKDIIFHELGHVVCNLYGLKPLEIAKDLLHTTLKTEVAEFVSTNLSFYSARSYESIISNHTEFDGAEIIAECFCAYYSGVENSFATSFLEKCIKATRR